MSSPDRHTAADEQLTIVDDPDRDMTVSTAAEEDIDEDPRQETDETPADDADIAEERIEAFAEAHGNAAVDAGPFDEEEERERRRARASSSDERSEARSRSL